MFEPVQSIRYIEDRSSTFDRTSAEVAPDLLFSSGV